MRNLTGPRLAAMVGLVLGFAPIANWLTAGRELPWWSAAVMEWLVLGGAIVLLAVAVARLGGATVERAAAWCKRTALAPRPAVFGAFLALVAFTLALWFAFYCYGGRFFSSDEMAQRLQANLLLQGRFFARLDAPPEFFSAPGVVITPAGRLYSQFPIGGPAAIALGVAIGVPWVINPLLTGLTALGVYRFAAAVYGEPIGRASGVLFALSPFVLFVGASQMNHVLTLAGVVLALVGLVRWDRGGGGAASAWGAALVGAGIGVAAATRPYDAVAVSVAIAAFQLARVARDRRLARSLAVQLLVGALPVAILLWANARTTGSPWLFGYDVLNGAAHQPGFHVAPTGVPHTPLRGLQLASGYLLRLDRYLFEWPLPGLLPVVVALALLPSFNRWDGLLLGSAGALLVAYACYWFDGFFAGPRFLYDGVPAAVIFAARAPGLLAGRFSGWGRRAVLLVMPLAILWAWAAPGRVSGVRIRAHYYLEGNPHYKADYGAAVAGAGLTHAIVFVDDGWHARLDARLRAGGLSVFGADKLVISADACRLQHIADSIATAPPGDTLARLQALFAAARPAAGAELAPVAGLAPVQQVLLVRGQPLAPDCLRELMADTIGMAPFEAFLPLEQFEPDGRLGGPVVFARDFGGRNELLRARFPDRAWFRYRPRRNPDDTTAVVVPYYGR